MMSDSRAILFQSLVPQDESEQTPVYTQMRMDHVKDMHIQATQLNAMAEFLLLVPSLAKCISAFNNNPPFAD
jgi:hypothetical protein